jgi:hypothetical protein
LFSTENAAARGKSNQSHRNLAWQKSPFTIAPEAASYGGFMTDIDLNLWGLIVVPVGLTICFGLALLVWLRDELRAGPEEEKSERRQS